LHCVIVYIWVEITNKIYSVWYMIVESTFKKFWVESKIFILIEKQKKKYHVVLQNITLIYPNQFILKYII